MSKGLSPCEQSTLWVNFFLQISYHDMFNFEKIGGAPRSGGLIRQVKISLTAPRVEGSNPGLSLSFIWSPIDSSNSQRYKKQRRKGIRWGKRNKARPANQGRKTGRHIRNGYEKGRRFRFAVWLNGRRHLPDWHGEKN